jgi:hypothetical protein
MSILYDILAFMITIYAAQSSIDANIVQDILALEGINSHVMGSYLEGGTGDLSVQNLVRVMAAEDDYKRAKTIIEAWENDLHSDGANNPEKDRSQTYLKGLEQKTQNPAILSTHKKTMLIVATVIFILGFYWLASNAV